MEPNMEQQDRSDTVTFNVGGKVFEVLREPTLSLHPDSLLCQLASDEESTGPIFVEANPDLFQYMLDYHRRRKIYIPCTVSKNAVLDQAQNFFCLPVKPDEVIQDLTTLRLAHDALLEVHDALLYKSQEVENSLKSTTLAILGQLVIKCALKKVDNSPGISVSNQDILTAEGIEEKRCTGNRGSMVKCGAGSPGPMRNINTFHPVMKFLGDRITKDDLRQYLEPWAFQNGYKISVTSSFQEGPPTYSTHYPTYGAFTCELLVKPDEVIQDATTLRLVHDALNIKSQEMENSLKSAKLATLGQLVIMRALKEVGNSAAELNEKFSVRNEDLLTRIEEKRCTGNYGTIVECGADNPSEYPMWNIPTFHSVMAFLTSGITEDDLRRYLEPWALQNGYKVSVTMSSEGGPPHYNSTSYYNAFTCKFS